MIKINSNIKTCSLLTCNESPLEPNPLGSSCTTLQVSLVKCTADKRIEYSPEIQEKISLMPKIYLNNRIVKYKIDFY